MNSCCCSTDIDNFSDLTVTTVRRARKPHVCCECGEEIVVGQSYENSRGLYDGHWSEYKTCTVCVAIRDDLCPCGHYCGELRGVLLECLGFDYTKDPAEWGDE
ncbi:MAG: hypothetical protein ABH877_04355 [bacterium]